MSKRFNASSKQPQNTNKNPCQKTSPSGGSGADGSSAHKSSSKSCHPVSAVLVFFVLHRRLGSWNCNWRSPTNNGQLIWSKIWNPLTNHMIKIQRRHQSPLQGSDDNFHIVCTPAVPAHQWSYLGFAQNAQLPASSLSNGWFLFGQALHIVQSLVSQCEGKLQTQWYTGLSSKSK